MKVSRTLTRTALAAWLAVGVCTFADDVYYEARVLDLTLSDGELPRPPEDLWARPWRSIGQMSPRVVLDGQGEAYLSAAGRNPWERWSPENATVTVRVPEGEAVRGVLIVPNAEQTGMVPLRFTLDPAVATAGSENAFHRDQRDHYRALQNLGAPGAAWFRFRADRAAAALGEHDLEPDDGWVDRDAGGFEETFALFTGGRAVAENLQLDRALPAVEPGERTVDVGSIRGITVQGYDWKAGLGDAAPELDPLASVIPEDQHAVFFPSFAAFMGVLDELSEGGLPLYGMATPRPEDAGTLQRYERQLGLSRDGLARVLGPRVIRSVAMTGSDPYFATGTDVALIFETADPPALRAALLAQVAAAAAGVAGAAPVEGEAGVAFAGFRSPSRLLCSYIAALDNAVVVTNSPVQLGRIASVRAGATPALASLDEYRFFRDRYARNGGEHALLVLTDATIRRWCGPRWRIGSARRTVAAAALADATARLIAVGDGGDGAAVVVVPDARAGDLGDLTITDAGVTSPVYGGLAFLTPIAEMGVDRVTQAEAEAYARWRDTYQQNWRRFFDPIAVRLTMDRGRLAGDMTVMPLIWGSDYRVWVEASRGAVIDPAGADPHDALAHFALAVDTDSPAVQQYGMMARSLGGVQIDPFDWLAGTVAFYMDPDPFWRQLAEAGPDGAEEVITAADFAIPVALHVQVGSSLKLAAFLNAVRTVVDQTTPGMTAWETRTHNEQAYVKVGLAETAKSGDAWDDAALYYAAMPRAFVLSPSEAVVRRAIERQQARRNAADAPDAAAPANPWLGDSLAMNLTGDGLAVLAALMDEGYRAEAQRRAWANIPILNEWKRLHPDRDPVEFHAEQFRTRPVCPAGGSYVWNERFRTMESTVYGHPGEPREGPDLPTALSAVLSGRFGLTFEEEGLRARVELEQEAKGR